VQRSGSSYSNGTIVALYKPVQCSHTTRPTKPNQAETPQAGYKFDQNRFFASSNLIKFDQNLSKFEVFCRFFAGFLQVFLQVFDQLFAGFLQE
jgi:hypothetical protein